MAQYSPKPTDTAVAKFVWRLAARRMQGRVGVVMIQPPCLWTEFLRAVEVSPVCPALWAALAVLAGKAWEPLLLLTLFT